MSTYDQLTKDSEGSNIPGDSGGISLTPRLVQPTSPMKQSSATLNASNSVLTTPTSPASKDGSSKFRSADLRVLGREAPQGRERQRSNIFNSSWVLFTPHNPYADGDTTPSTRHTPVFAPGSAIALAPEKSKLYISARESPTNLRDTSSPSSNPNLDGSRYIEMERDAKTLNLSPYAQPTTPWTASTRHSCLLESKNHVHEEEVDKGSDGDSECDLRIQESFEDKHQGGGRYYDPLGAMYDSDATRAWHVDWMRFVANWLVVSVHFVRTVKEMELSASEGQTATLNAFLVNLLQIGMPIFFYASGRASGFSNDRSFWLYLQKKCLRLLVPLLASYFTVLLPAALISGPFYESRDDSMPESTWSNLGESIKWWLKRFPVGCIEWLWYLPALAALGVITYPYCLWLNTWHLCTAPDRLLPPRDKQAKEKLFATYRLDPNDVYSLPYIQRLLISPVRNITLWLSLTGIVATLVCAFVHRHYRMRPGLMTTYSLGFLLPPFILMLILPWCRRLNWRTPIFAIFPIISIIFAFIKERTFADLNANGLDNHNWAIVMSSPYYIAFYLQGHLEQRFMYEWEHYERMAIRSSSGKMTTSFIFRPFKVILWVALWANGCPGFSQEWGYMWAYPLYRKTYTTVSYVVASWVALHFWERFMAFYARTNISPAYHKHVINMSLIVYIFHGLHIALVGRIVIWPFRSHLQALGGILIFVVLVIPMTVLTYAVIINIPPLATVFGVGGGFKTWRWSNWGQPGKRAIEWIRNNRALNAGRYDNDLMSLDENNINGVVTTIDEEESRER